MGRGVRGGCVMPPLVDHPHPALDAGRSALLRGDWSAACAALLDAIRALPEPCPEAAEAWEGLGIAYYWSGDARAATAAHERAFRQYTELGAGEPAARAALWLVDEQLAFFDASAVANGWLEQAERLLAGVPTCVVHAWLRAYRGHYALVVEGDARQALEHARAGLEVARSLGAGEAEVVLLAVEGLALVTLGEVRSGMARLDAASAAAVTRDLRDLNAVAWVCCYLVHGCGNVRDFARAAEWCVRVLAFCERWGLQPVYASCRLDYASVLTWQGAWAAAESELSLIGGADGSPAAPALEPPRRSRLAELRRRQGRLDEAEALLQAVGEQPLALLVAAASALDRGEPGLAFDLSDRSLRLLPEAGGTERVDPLLVRVRAAAALGWPERSAADVEELASIAGRVDGDPFHAAVAFARGVLARLHDDDAAAAVAFEVAVSLHDRARIPYETAQSRLELADALARLGRNATARREAERARAAFADLGAQRDLQRAEAFLHALSPAGRAGGRAAGGALTTREVEVLRLVARGGSNQQIAAELFLSAHTVKRHVANILRKLHAPSRAAAVARAAGMGLFP
jgi:LuxR family transcriptional regulator, maltose regulon positive regulatory protein